tara:strand:- start:841 stop:999 length:159 start_codon:yes stop_codon:yes gene_type:complete
VANFKVSGDIDAEKVNVNSDMGSDCAYFEGPDNHSQNEYIDRDEDYEEEELK